MTTLEAVALYYDAWQNKRGDFSEVPLADDFAFTGPVASFDTANGYRAMAAEAGAAVTSFNVRRQFVDGTLVCSIIDWEMAIPGLGRMTSAELLEVEDGVVVRGELIYDAENLRRVIAAGWMNEESAAEPERFRGELQLHCYRIVGSVQDAEDLVQETLLAAWRGHDGSRDGPRCERGSTASRPTAA